MQALANFSQGGRRRDSEEEKTQSMTTPKGEICANDLFALPSGLQEFVYFFLIYFHPINSSLLKVKFALISPK